MEPSDAVLEATQSHESIAVLHGDARAVGVDDQRRDAAAAAVVRGHSGHDDDQFRDHAVGGPQLDAVEEIGGPVLGGRGGARHAGGSDPTSGSVRRNAVTAPAAQRGRKRCFCSAVPNIFTGSGTPMD